MTQPVGARGARSTSTRGPKILTFSGIAALVAGLAALFAAVGLFVAVLPLDVLAADGGPGSGVLAVVPAPGSATATLDTGSYLVYLAAPRDTSPLLEGAISVTDADGDAIRVGSSSISGSVSNGSTEAHTVAGFEVPADGSYLITAPPAQADEARLLVLEDSGVGTFVGQVAGTVGAVFLGIGLGIVGLGLTIGGGIWWYLRRQRRSGTSNPGR